MEDETIQYLNECLRKAGDRIRETQRKCAEDPEFKRNYERQIRDEMNQIRRNSVDALYNLQTSGGVVITLG